MLMLLLLLLSQVIDHYENPRNVGKLDAKKSNVGTGLVGAPACGDVMKLQIEVRDGDGIKRKREGEETSLLICCFPPLLI